MRVGEVGAWAGVGTIGKKPWMCLLIHAFFRPASLVRIAKTEPPHTRTFGAAARESSASLPQPSARRFCSDRPGKAKDMSHVCFSSNTTIEVLQMFLS